MSEKVRILSFYENWVDIMEMCNPEEWYELTTIITNLRFKNIDTDPKTLTNIKVKMAWTAIRPSILKSNRNSRYQDKKSNTELQANTDFEKEAEISPNKPDFYSDDTEVPQEVESASEGPIQGEFDDLELEEDMGTFIGTLNNFAVETRRIEHEEEMSMDNMLKCLTVFDINKAKHQVFKSITIDENMKRVADCLDPLLGGFSKTDRSRLYISIIEDVLNT
jgi:hypothetical protein